MVWRWLDSPVWTLSLDPAGNATFVIVCIWHQSPLSRVSSYASSRDAPSNRGRGGLGYLKQVQFLFYFFRCWISHSIASQPWWTFHLIGSSRWVQSTVDMRTVICCFWSRGGPLRNTECGEGGWSTVIGGPLLNLVTVDENKREWARVVS